MYLHKLISIAVVLAVATILASLHCPVARAQSGAAISGTVLDKSGAAITGAKVTVENTDTGLTRELVTDEAGRYLAPQLPLGNYSVQASQTGFRSELRHGIVLTVGSEAVVNLELEVGTMSQKVEVTAEASQVETTSASVDYLVPEKTIQDLPLNGRDYTQLATLQPGVSNVNNVGRHDGVTGNGTDLSLSGTQTRQNLFLMDGQDLNDSSGGTPGSAAGTNLGLDAIREFS